jgi:hypothetical protein
VLLQYLRERPAVLAAAMYRPPGQVNQTLDTSVLEKLGDPNRSNRAGKRACSIRVAPHTCSQGPP